MVAAALRAAESGEAGQVYLVRSTAHRRSESGGYLFGDHLFFLQKMTIFDKIAKYRVVPVITIESADKAVPLADALIAGGLPVAEITFRTAAAATVIRRLSEERPQLLVGAGTILTQENLLAAQAAGAAFGVAPGLNPAIVQAARDAGFPFVPGVCTPTDVEAALAMGCKHLKFFPAGAMGGVNFLNAITAPYAHTGVRFMPTGGVNASTLAEYLRIPSVLACGGTWIASKDDIAQDRWILIADRCKEVCEIVEGLS